jgi:hypothetical protein
MGGLKHGKKSRILYDEQLCDLYNLPCIVSVIKFQRIQKTKKWRPRNACSILEE